MKSQFNYFEDYQIAQAGVTVPSYPSRTVTEVDIVNFACITGDYSTVHVDRHNMANSLYGARVAHGLLGTSMVTGMLSLNAPHILGRGVPGAYLYDFLANYRAGLKVDDTIHLEWRVAEKVDDPPYEGFGLVKTTYEVVNQDGASLYDGYLSTLVRKESAKDAILQLKAGEPFPVEEYVPDPQHLYVAEDYVAGRGGETEGRTITETDIVNFAGLTGDYNPQYVDALYASQDIYGERIAPPMLVFTVAYGIWTRDWHHYKNPKTNFAGHLNDAATFLAPVKIGDTIRCRYKAVNTRPSRSNPNVGIQTVGLQVVNQRNEVVQEGSTVNMVASREGALKQSAT